MSTAYPSVEAVQAAVRSSVVDGDEQAAYWQLISVAENCPACVRQSEAAAAVLAQHAYAL